MGSLPVIRGAAPADNSASRSRIVASFVQDDDRRTLVAEPLRKSFMSSADHPVTPDGRYFVVRGRLWRRTNPGLASTERERLTRQLMDARRAIGRIKRSGQGDLAAARAAVDAAKVSLGERGPAWWDDGAPDFNRRMARTTPYRHWFAALA